MNKDEIQQTKALIKLKGIKRIINILQDLNLLENDEDMKDYEIVLDYKKDKKQDFTTFIINVNTSGLNEDSMRVNRTLFDFNFKLKDEDSGFLIFKNIREYFVKQNDLQYPSFQRNELYNLVGNNELEFSSYRIRTNHHVNLISMIHSKEDQEKLQKLNSKIFEKYRTYIRKVHNVDYDKDMTQLQKALKKSELVIAVIDMLDELKSTSSINGKLYNILLDCEPYNDFYVFKIQILKNDSSVPLNIKFKLNDKKTGIEIFNRIVKYYIENIDIIDSSDHKSNGIMKTDYRLVGKKGLNINYRIPNEYFDECFNIFNNTINEKLNSKKLEKTN